VHIKSLNQGRGTDLAITMHV